ncbi:hypothetical protein JD844_009267 [Phrynosoma platyrhinos]|uniref:Ig-like domain-containing protein n=1 Tax=Phrynosoma platyrhinos TaxID=52577 RepID=A0ABQ7TFZ1_PHRPL|nr:hypothetical protein JD844_009267 [Phrynosoma platyrhinos]
MEGGNTKNVFQVAKLHESTAARQLCEGVTADQLDKALFTVDALQPRYSVEHGGNVTMGCRFPARDPFNLTTLSVLWQKKASEGHEVKEVYKLSKGQENLRQQHTDYRGRVTLLPEELKMGHSMLHINNVKVTDAGIYVCLVHDEGVDLKYINLDVEAHYKTINFHKRKEKEDLILTCQSEGYPLAEVSWHNENTNLSTSAVTTYQLTEDGLFSITSTLRVKSLINGNYSCVFWNRELNEKTSAHGPALEHDYHWFHKPFRYGKTATPLIDSTNLFASIPAFDDTLLHSYEEKIIHKLVHPKRQKKKSKQIIKE